MTYLEFIEYVVYVCYVGDICYVGYCGIYVYEVMCPTANTHYTHNKRGSIHTCTHHSICNVC